MVPGRGDRFQPRGDLRGLRALIVDDNATNRTILDRYLTAWGLTCICVDGAAGALDALERAAQEGRPFKLAVLDLHMPHMNGIELARVIRQRPWHRGLRMMMLTSSAADLDALREAAIAVSLSKPARQSELYDAIVQTLADQPALSTPSGAAQPAKLEQASDGARAGLSAGAFDGDEEFDERLAVLVAEDNEVNRMVAGEMLGQRGLTVTFAHNGREAVELAGAGEYAVVMMDCQMPEVDGYEATRRIRDAEHLRRVPIVAMTAHSMRGDRERCLAAGMDDHLPKPVRPQELDAVLRRWLPARAGDSGSYAGAVPIGRPPDELAQPAVPTVALHPTGPPAQPRAGEILDHATIDELVSTLRVDMRVQLLAAFDDSLPGRLADTIGPPANRTTTGCDAPLTCSRAAA